MILTKKDGTKHVTKEFENEEHLVLYTENMNICFESLCNRHKIKFEKIHFDKHILPGFETTIYTISEKLVNKINDLGLTL